MAISSTPGTPCPQRWQYSQIPGHPRANSPGTPRQPPAIAGYLNRGCNNLTNESCWQLLQGGSQIRLTDGTYLQTHLQIDKSDNTDLQILELGPNLAESICKLWTVANYCGVDLQIMRFECVKTAGLLSCWNYEAQGFANSEKHITYAESICKLCNSIEMLRGGLAKGFATAPF